MKPTVILAAALLCVLSPFSFAKPLKVFILAGQSNMEGHASVKTFDYIGEFGRTPCSPDGNGRDHNHKGYTTWMAGGGVRGGFSHGETDEHGYEAVVGKVHIHDWHATILHLLGLDHERLTFRHAGREMRLTDVKGNVAKEIVT